MELVVKTRDGTPVTHDVTKNAVRMVGADGEAKDFVSTDNVPVLLENVEVTPDFSAGDQVFTAPDGMAVKSGIVRKPANLIPENIAEGVDIAGIIGTMVAGGGGGDIVVSSGRVSGNDILTSKKINHNLGVMPDLVVVFPTGALNSTYKFAGLVYLSPEFAAKCSSDFTSDRYEVSTASTGVTTSNPTGITATATSITFTKSPYVSLYYYYIAIGGLT